MDRQRLAVFLSRQRRLSGDAGRLLAAVAGNDDVLCTVFDRFAPKCVDCLEPRLAEAGSDFGLEAPIRFSELPVSRMDEFQNTSL